jgi:hypothetical protein
MSKDLISKKTRYEFREYFVGTTLREIEREFDAADIAKDEDYVSPESGQRRSLVEQYYRTIDWTQWRDVKRVLVLYANVLAGLEDLPISKRGFDGGKQAGESFESLKKWIERDGFVYSSGRLIARGDVVQLPDVHEASIQFDAPELQRQVERMRNAVDDDPALAIGTAKELIETTCKTILHDRGVEFDDSADLVKLVTETRKALGLMPENVPHSARGADVIRRLLGSLGTVAQGLGELRNMYGTGHGRRGQVKGLASRHARLAVGSAATLAMFLFETHQERE